jgi:hypothetical protein
MNLALYIWPRELQRAGWSDKTLNILDASMMSARTSAARMLSS